VFIFYNLRVLTIRRNQLQISAASWQPAFRIWYTTLILWKITKVIIIPQVLKQHKKWAEFWNN